MMPYLLSKWLRIYWCKTTFFPDRVDLAPSFLSFFLSLPASSETNGKSSNRMGALQKMILFCRIFSLSPPLRTNLSVELTLHNEMLSLYLVFVGMGGRKKDILLWLLFLMYVERRMWNYFYANYVMALEHTFRYAFFLLSRLMTAIYITDAHEIHTSAEPGFWRSFKAKRKNLPALRFYDAFFCRNHMICERNFRPETSLNERFLIPFFNSSHSLNCIHIKRVNQASE